MNSTQCRDIANNIPKPDFKVLPQSMRIYFVSRIFGDLGMLFEDESMKEDGDPPLEMSELIRLFRVHFESLYKMRGDVPIDVLFQYLTWSYINWFPSFSEVVTQIKMKVGLKYGNVV